MKPGGQREENLMTKRGRKRPSVKDTSVKETSGSFKATEVGEI